MRLIRICPEGQNYTCHKTTLINLPSFPDTAILNQPSAKRTSCACPCPAGQPTPATPKSRAYKIAPPPRQNLTQPFYAGAARTRPPLFPSPKSINKRAAGTTPAALHPNHLCAKIAPTQKKSTLRPNRPCAKERKRKNRPFTKKRAAETTSAALRPNRPCANKKIRPD